MKQIQIIAAIEVGMKLVKQRACQKTLQDVEDDGQIQIFPWDTSGVSGGSALSGTVRGLASARGAWSMSGLEEVTKANLR